MRITRDITTPRERETAVALGFFDGVHLGHQAVIGLMVKAAREQGLLPAVFTFDSTGSLPGSKSKLTLLQTDRQKQEVMEQMGVGEIVSPDFSEFMHLTPQEFVDRLLVGVLRAKVLVCGENYRFGAAAAAGVSQLRQMSRERGVTLMVAPSVVLEGELVSSTRIRRALEQGDPQLVEKMLGMPFTIEGQVLPGKKLGRSIHSPTINQKIPPHFTVPAHGVYLSRATTPLGEYWGVTNIGQRPTVGGLDINCETFLLDFGGDLYGRTVTVSLLRHIRPEQKFQTVAELSAQIQQDVQSAKVLISEIQDKKGD